MAQILSPRQQIENARSQALAVRAQLEQRQKEAQEAENILTEQKKSLPQISNRLLRQGMFSGLEGKKRRNLIGLAQSQIQEREREIKSFKEELGRFEKSELKPFEQNINTAAARVSAIEEIQNLAKKSLDKYGAGTYSSSGLKRANELLGSEGKQIFRNMVLGNYFSSLSGDTNRGSLSGTDPIVDGKAVAFTPDPSQYTLVGSTPQGGGIWISNVPSSKVSMSIAPPRDLSRTDIMRDFSKLKVLQDTKPKDSNVRTTGSPLRMTKLNSNVSRGYIKDNSMYMERNVSNRKQNKQNKFTIFKKEDKKPIKNKKFSWGF